jgi:hypothetical protein
MGSMRNAKSWPENLEEMKKLGKPSVEGRIISDFMLKKQDGKLLNKFMRISTETSGWLL